MLGIVGLIILGVAAIGGIWYFHKNASTVPDGSSVLHYHIVSAHTIYKKDTK